MAKFILHGGFTPGNTHEDNSDFYSEILKDAPENARILLVLFAKSPDRWAAGEEKLKVEFNNTRHAGNISFEVAQEDGFMEQVRTSDVIYLSGGVSKNLLDVLEKFPSFENALAGKTVAGESGGANVLAKFFYSPSASQVFEGLGILAVKIIPHYSKEKEGLLDNVGEGLEELFLSEYAYKVFYKEY
ncbi:MAG: hypothetical protein JWM20_872 [Patescibacteria group bacterium]|nr:hypothetical protein [Patescibacteria group bacterium]